LQLVVTAAVLLCGVSRILADEGTPSKSGLSEVIITGKRVPVPDEVMTQRIEQTLLADRYFYGEHVTITTINGVVHLEGFVFGYSDL
jgi:osmotically-inducible protein OsmY